MELYLAPKACFAFCPALHTTVSNSFEFPCSAPCPLPRRLLPATDDQPPPFAFTVPPLISPGFHLLSAAPPPPQPDKSLSGMS